MTQVFWRGRWGIEECELLGFASTRRMCWKVVRTHSLDGRKRLATWYPGAVTEAQEQRNGRYGEGRLF